MVLAVGLQSPIVMLLAFVPMLFIAIGYQQLNRPMPDCGTTFTWGTKAFGPKVGWMGGWGIIAADVIVMANLAQIAGQLHVPRSSAPTGWPAASGGPWRAGMLWIVVMALICYIGIEIAAMHPVRAARHRAGHAGHVQHHRPGQGVRRQRRRRGHIHPAWSWFNPFHLSFSALTSGMLIAIFIYWGWDTAVSVNEETRDKSRAPGTAAVTSTVVLLLVYVLVTVAAQAFAGVGTKGIGLDNPDNSGDVLSVLGGEVFGTNGFGWFLAKLLVLMVLSSAAASTLTTILPTARTTLSMAAYRSIPAKFARIHPRYLTPTWSTVGMAIVSIGFYVLMTIVSENVLADTITAIGLMIAFYYGLTGFTCVWWFRKDLRNGGQDLWLKGILPFVGRGGPGLLLLQGRLRFWNYTYGSSYWTMPFSPHWKIGGVFLTGIGALVSGRS